jgi:hypothetical protein
MKVAILIIFALSNSVAVAKSSATTPSKKVNSRKLASDPAGELIHLTVAFGDKTTEFSLKNDSGNYTAEISSYPDTQKKVRVQTKDAEYLLSKFNALSSDVDSSGKCPRQTLIARGVNSNNDKEKHVGGCIGADSPESKELLSLANLFSALF